MVASSAKSNTGSGVVMSDRPTSAWPTNNASTENIMKTFHSSGTPIGIADRMPKWKQSITNAAIAVGQPPWENNSANGTNISIAVLKCAMNRDTGPGRRSSGNFSKNFRFSHLVRISGLFDIIVEITNGKCLLSFDVAAPIQIATHTSLAAMIMSTP